MTHIATHLTHMNIQHELYRGASFRAEINTILNKLTKKITNLEQRLEKLETQSVSNFGITESLQDLNLQFKKTAKATVNIGDQIEQMKDIMAKMENYNSDENDTNDTSDTISAIAVCNKSNSSEKGLEFEQIHDWCDVAHNETHE